MGADDTSGPSDYPENGYNAKRKWRPRKSAFRNPIKVFKSLKTPPLPADEIHNNGTHPTAKNTYACCCVSTHLVPNIGVGVLGVIREMLKTAMRTKMMVIVRKRLVIKV